MKIAYLSSSKIPSKTANSVHVMKICEAFANNGHTVDLYAQYNLNSRHKFFFIRSRLHKKYGVEKNFKLIRSYRINTQAKKMNRLSYIISCMPKILFRNYDLFYARNIIQASKVIFLKKPIIIELHQIPKSEDETTAIKKVINHCENHKFVAITKALRMKYLELFPELEPANIIVAYDCANIPKKTLSEKNIDKNIGYVGHFYKGKGVELILELAQIMPDRTFYIVGGNNKDITRVKKECKSKNVIFTGFVNNGELYRFYAKFDIALAPYQEEVEGCSRRSIGKYMSPLKLFEYMSYKKAIVSSDWPILREVLHDKENALLCPHDDIVSWKDAIESLDDPEYRNRIVENAYDDFLLNYTWDERAKVLLL